MSTSYSMKYDVASGDFTNAGNASRQIKSALMKLGIDNSVVRKTSIATYEAEMNLAIHSLGGFVMVEVFEDKVRITVKDVGPGIPNVELAMTEGYSTASNEVREMGFGAGMGLPNMKLHSDEFSIESKMGVGTTIMMAFYVKG